MDEVVLRGLKLVVLLGIAGLFLTAGLWVYLVLGLMLGLAGPMFGGVVLLYVVNDVYTTVTGG